LKVESILFINSAGSPGERGRDAEKPIGRPGLKGKILKEDCKFLRSSIFLGDSL
jgi:hypothetical protein